MDLDRVRVRLHWGGLFECAQNWLYAGGEVFNESIPAGCKYADLCLKINEKVGQTTSIKYLAPGEELSPHELVSVTGDDDLQELYDEYFNAIQRPGTPIKTFRIKMFLSPALQDELDTDDRHGQGVFDPNEWCDGTDGNDCDGLEGNDCEGLDGIACDELIPDEPEQPSSDMQWERDMDPHFVPAFTDRPAEHDTSGLFGARGNVAMELLDRHALGNLLCSVSRSCRRGITEEIGLPDPYHESEDSKDYVPGRRRCHLAPDGAPLLQAVGRASRLAPEVQNAAHVVVSQGVFPPSGGNGYSSMASLGSLVLPIHTSAFGHDIDEGAGAGGCALSAADDGATPNEDLDADNLPADCPMYVHFKPATVSRPGETQATGFHLPSFISAFGKKSASNDMDMPDMSRAAMDNSTVEGLHHTSKCITQDFNREGSHDEIPISGDVFAADGEADGIQVEIPAEPFEVADATPVLVTPKLLDEVCRVPRDEVHIIRKIGEGAFGEVSYANVESHGLVAVKWLKRDRFAKYSESFMREAEVLAKLNHPNIIRMYGVVIEPPERNGSGSGDGFDRDSFSSRDSAGTRHLLTEQPIIAGIMTDFVRGGSLSGQLRAAKRRPTLKERCQVAVQAGRGMAYLHSQNPAVIHFDLKPDNLLVDGDGETLHVKVADFGLSKQKFLSFVSCRDLRGTLPYMAPELVNNPNQVSERCDVWSMGVVMWEMYSLEIPYNDMTAQQILGSLMDGSIHLHIPSSCEPEWRGLIEMCMDPNPNARPTFKQLTTHLDAILRQIG